MAATQPGILEPGTRFGAYTIVRKLGAGGMGAVYEATHSELKKRVALKTLLPTVTDSVDLQARFVREGQAAARIQHAHVVDIYDVGMLDGISFLIMEYLEGEDLSAYFRNKGEATFEEVLDIMLPVCSAIQAAHDAGIVHRDLKPANIFLTKLRTGEFVPKVLDFGISKIVSDKLGSTLTGAGEILGTPFYMSPEQAAGLRELDAQSDQYSLGIILYQYLTGRRPFDGPSMYGVLHSIVSGDFPPPQTIKPDLPEEVSAAILKAMQRLPTDRFSSVRELGSALLPFARSRTQAIWESEFLSTHTNAPRAALPRSTSVRPAPMVEASRGSALSEPSLAFAPTLTPTSTQLTPTAPPKRSYVMVGALVAVPITLALGWFAYSHSAKPTAFEAKSVDARPLLDPPPLPAPTDYAMSISATPSEAQIEVDGQLLGRGHVETRYPKDGREHVLRVVLQGYESQVMRFVDAPPPGDIRLSKIAESQGVEVRRPKKEAPARKAALVQPVGNPTDNAPREENETVRRGANNALILQ